MTSTQEQTIKDLLLAQQSGDRSEVARLKAEYYNDLAQDFKSKNDLLGLNLLAALDESEKAELHDASAHLSLMLMFYLSGRENFDRICGEAYAPTDYKLVLTIKEIRRTAEYSAQGNTAR